VKKLSVVNYPAFSFGMSAVSMRFSSTVAAKTDAALCSS